MIKSFKFLLSQPETSGWSICLGTLDRATLGGVECRVFERRLKRVPMVHLTYQGCLKKRAKLLAGTMGMQVDNGANENAPGHRATKRGMDVQKVLSFAPQELSLTSDVQHSPYVQNFPPKAELARQTGGGSDSHCRCPLRCGMAMLSPSIERHCWGGPSSCRLSSGSRPFLFSANSRWLEALTLPNGTATQVAFFANTAAGVPVIDVCMACKSNVLLQPHLNTKHGSRFFSTETNTPGLGSLQYGASLLSTPHYGPVPYCSPLHAGLGVECWLFCLSGVIGYRCSDLFPRS